LESYGDEGRIYFLGRVRYDEPRLSLTSNFLTYYQKDERVVATGDVNARLPSGSTLKGPVAEYYRAIPGTRPNARIFASGRPVISKGKAKAVSEDMTLTSDTIDLRITDDLLQRAIAFGPTRARASSPSQQIVSDSIDVTMPAQRIREMHAVRKALAEGKPDSTRFKADTVDWMRGDTIVARFDTTATRDTSRAARMKEIIAVGNAKSYYHLAPSDSTADKLAINYVVG